MSSLLVFGCGDDAVSPRAVAGTYVLAGFIDSIAPGTPVSPQYPFLDATGIVDSMHDTLVINADGTYQETGGIWGYEAVAGSVSHLISAHGTYLLSDSNSTVITLTPSSGSNVLGGVGILQHDTLGFPRYPGAWKFSKS